MEYFKKEIKKPNNFLLNVIDSECCSLSKTLCFFHNCNALEINLQLLPTNRFLLSCLLLIRCMISIYIFWHMLSPFIYNGSDTFSLTSLSYIPLLKFHKFYHLHSVITFLFLYRYTAYGIYFFQQFMNFTIYFSLRMSAAAGTFIHLMKCVSIPFELRCIATMQEHKGEISYCNIVAYFSWSDSLANNHVVLYSKP